MAFPTVSGAGGLDREPEEPGWDDALRMRGVREWAKEDVVGVVELAYRRVRRLVAALDGMVMSAVSERLGREFTSAAELLHRRLGEKFEKSSQPPAPAGAQAPDPNATKVDSVLRVLNGLRQAAVLIKLSPT